MREPSGHVWLSEVSLCPRSLNDILALNQLADNDHPFNFEHAHHTLGRMVIVGNCSITAQTDAIACIQVTFLS